jgi:alpha-1,6-mannosyltransferase
MVPVSVATFAAVTLVSGFGLGWIGHLNTAGDLISWVSIPTGLALVGGHFARALGYGDVHRILIPNMRLTGEAIASLLTALLWVGVCRAHPMSRATVARGLGLALVALVLLGPIVQPWYLLWPLAFLAVVPPTPRWQTVIAGITVWASLLVTPQGATLFDRLIAVFAAAVAAVVGAVVVLGQHESAPAGTRPGPRGTPVATTKM